MIVMPDVQVVCTSSTEYDLRFYDTAAKKFDLRISVRYVLIKYAFLLKFVFILNLEFRYQA